MASVEIKSGSSYVKQTVGLNKLPQQSYCLLTFGTFGGENYTLFTLVATHFRSRETHLRGNVSLHLVCMLFH